MKRGALLLSIVAALLIAAVVGLERWITASHTPLDPSVTRRAESSGASALSAQQPAATSVAPGATEQVTPRRASKVVVDVASDGASDGAAQAARSWLGRVVDVRSGAPIEGATIRWDALGDRVETISGADGDFELQLPEASSRAGFGRAEFGHAAYATAVRPKVDSAVEREWGLWPAAVIEGVVGGAGAATGESVEVCLWSSNWPGEVEPELTIVEATRDGAFRFDGLTPGVYALMASSPTAAPAVRGGLALGVGGSIELELELERGARLEGRVLDRATRAGVAAATLELAWKSPGLPAVVQDWSRRSTVAADDGRFVVTGLATGAHHATVHAPWGARVEQDLFIEQPGDRVERDVLVGQCAKLIGTVRSPQGGAVAGARVALFAAEHLAELAGASSLGRVSATSAADGSFELVDLPPRERMILIAFPPASSELCASEARTIDLRPEEERQAFDVELGAGCTLHGRVEDGNGRAIADAQVELTHRSKIGDWEGVALRTDADGRFEFPPLPAGRASLTTTASGFAPLRSKVRLRTDRELSETLRLRVATTVTGAVVDSKGWGIPYARVRLRRISAAPAGAPKREQLRESADAFGAFRFEAVPDGRWVPDAALDGWALERVEPSELAVPADTDVRMVLNPNLRRSVVVRGRVLVDGETPRELALEGISGLKAVDRGRFTISGMAPGRSKLTVRARNALPRTVRLDLTSGGEIDVGEIMLVHGTRLIVRLSGPDRRPVRKASVRIEPVKLVPKSRRGRYGVPVARKLDEGKAGQYGDVLILPGRWRVRVEARGFAPVERSVRVRAKKRQVVPLELER